LHETIIVVGERNRNPEGGDSLILTSKLMRSLPIVALTLALGTVMTPAAAQSPAEFYKGKTITIMLGHPPGGSYDLYARLAADHMKRFIPGNPNIIVQHRPGGGGVAARASHARRAT